jgi:thermostable 8-oxoguanine DNA glycosylase
MEDMKTKYEVVITLTHWETYNTLEEAKKALKEIKRFPGQRPAYIREVKLP